MVASREDISYEADGRTMVGRLALPDGDDARPGVLIAHEGNGLDDIQKDLADRFASLGYVAFALDYHGGGVPLADREEISARVGGLMDDPDRTRALGQAGLDVLLGHDRVDPARVAAVGYCFGGTMVLELARAGAPLRAVVGMHSGLSTRRPAGAATTPATITASILVCIGADDPIVPPAERLAFEEEMRAAGVDWRLHVHGGAKHSFTNPRAAEFGFDALEYHRPTDERSWRAMLDLFDEVLAPPSA